jgi:hypothetical protein
VHETGEQAKEMLDQLNPENWPKSVGEAGAGLRQGQLEALPQFAKELSDIADYDRVAIEKADAYYQSGNGGNLDLRASLQFGKPYGELQGEERLAIAKQSAPETGATGVLLQETREAAKAATHVNFGGG